MQLLYIYFMLTSLLLLAHYILSDISFLQGSETGFMSLVMCIENTIYWHAAVD